MARLDALLLALQEDVDRQLAQRAKVRAAEPEIPKEGKIIPEMGIPPSGIAEIPEWAETPDVPAFAPVEDMPFPITPPSEPSPVEPLPVEPIKKEYAWWEKPAEITQIGMEKVGQVIAGMPVLPGVLKWAAPGFEWFEKNIEKPWGAIITSPLRPQVEWKPGEDWLTHEKRAYEEWESPTYVKGAAEFSMPLWWLPWFGWAAKGAKAVTGASKSMKGISALMKSGELLAKSGKEMVMPSFKTFNDQIAMNTYKKFALWAEHVPVMKQIAEAMGGPAAFLKKEPVTLADQARNMALYRLQLREMGNNIVDVKSRQVLAALDRTTPNDLFKIKEGLVGVVKTDATHEGIKIGDKVSLALDDVITHPEKYLWPKEATQARNVVDKMHDVAKYFKEMAEANGVKLPERFDQWGEYFKYLPRIVAGRDYLPNWNGLTKLEQAALTKVTTAEKWDLMKLTEKLKLAESIDLKKHFMKAVRTDPFANIVYETAMQGMEAGVKYSDDLIGRIQLMGHAVARKIADKQFDDVVKGRSFPKWAELLQSEQVALAKVITAEKWDTLKTSKRLEVAISAGIAKKPLGELASKRWLKYEPVLAEQYTKAMDKIGVLRNLRDHSKNLLAGAGATLGKPIRKDLLDKLTDIGRKDLADKIDQLQRVSGINVARYIKRMSVSAQSKLKLDMQPLTETLKMTKQKISREELAVIVSKFSRKVGKEDIRFTKFIEKVYQTELKSEIKLKRKDIRALVKEIDDIVDTEWKATKGLRTEVWNAKRTWGKVRELEGEARFRVHPAFGKMIFPKEVVDTLTPFLSDPGSKWLAKTSEWASLSRMSVAALDLSWGFIQGLLAFGRNPLAWAKAQGNVLKFVMQPHVMNAELVKREASIMEQVAYGASSSAFDYFKAMPFARKVARKIAGEKGEKVIIQTYGRMEAAYIGGSVIARDELYKAGKFMILKKNLPQEETERLMRELVRVNDRMTGVMSSKALGIGLTQRQIESSFVFFAPQYTRAAMSAMADMLRGGYTGAEMRKSLAGFLLGATTFYKGVTEMTGQQPNLDPRNARFMTIKVGDSHVGIGGIYYAMMRFMADVVATAGEEPTAMLPLNLSRTDNPFYKFMYSRTSQLTGLGFGLAVEHKNYLGEPFESVADYAKFLVDKAMPISMQALIPQTNREYNPLQAAMAAGIQFTGAREFPTSTWERRDATRDALAQQKYQKLWADLTRAEQRTIEGESTELTQLGKEITRRQLQRGQKKQVLFNQYRDQIDEAQERRDERIRAYGELAQETKDYVKFRERVEDVENDYAAELKGITETKIYEPLKEWLEEPLSVEQLSKKERLDIAAYFWQKTRYSKAEIPKIGKLYDEAGEPEWRNIDKFRQAFKEQFGQDALDYVEKVLPLSGRNLPPIYIQLRMARETLRPYWAVKSYFMDMLGEPKTAYQARRIDSLTQTVRKRMRLTDKGVGEAYNMFYKRT